MILIEPTCIPTMSDLHLSSFILILIQELPIKVVSGVFDALYETASQLCSFILKLIQELPIKVKCSGFWSISWKQPHNLHLRPVELNSHAC